MTTTCVRALTNLRNDVDFVPTTGGDSPKSLRELARELGVSASYLSQVKSGRCKASKRLLNMLSKSKLEDTLQIRWGALNMSPVGSTPMRSRQFLVNIKEDELDESLEFDSRGDCHYDILGHVVHDF